MSLSKNADNLPVVLIPGFMLDETLWDDFIAVFPDCRLFIPASLNNPGYSRKHSPETT